MFEKFRPLQNHRCFLKIQPWIAWVELAWGSVIPFLFGFDGILISPCDWIALDRPSAFVHSLCATRPEEFRHNHYIFYRGFRLLWHGRPPVVKIRSSDLRRVWIAEIRAS